MSYQIVPMRSPHDWIHDPNVAGIEPLWRCKRCDITVTAINNPDPDARQPCRPFRLSDVTG